MCPGVSQVIVSSVNSSIVRPIRRATTAHVQSLVIRLDGITAGDYLTWVRDPEPLALDHGLRSVAISAEPFGELINVDLIWADRPPTRPTAAAVAAGFPLIPEVAAVCSVAGASYLRRPMCATR
jgi:hypothetical protein